MSALVTLRDAIEGLYTVPEASAALVLTDPPSGATRAPFDTPVDLGRFWPAAWRILQPGGYVVLLCSSLHLAAEALKSQRQHFRYDLVWAKSLASGFLNSARMPLRAHEFVVVFSRGDGRVYNPQMMPGGTPIHKARRRSHGENYNPQTRSTESRAGVTDRFPVSVLEFATVGTSSKERVHPQQKPLPLLQWLIRTYTHAGDLVVDPYAGSGSTGHAAEREGRRFIGFDSSPRFGSQV